MAYKIKTKTKVLYETYKGKTYPVERVKVFLDKKNPNTFYYIEQQLETGVVGEIFETGYLIVKHNAKTGKENYLLVSDKEKSNLSNFNLAKYVPIQRKFANYMIAEEWLKEYLSNK